jgi:hypothetical protein
MLPFVLRSAGTGQGVPGRLRALGRIADPALRPEGQFRASCEVAQLLSERLGMDAAVRRALWQAFERWDGRGVPEHVQGDNVNIVARVVLVAQDAVVFYQLEDTQAATDIVRERAGGAYVDLRAHRRTSHSTCLRQDWRLDPWRGRTVRRAPRSR